MSIYFSLFFLTFLLTFFFKEIAIKRNNLDIPNERSLHTIPVPRNGGFSIVIIFLSCLLFFYFNSLTSIEVIKTILPASFLIALVGYLDDLYDISPLVRLLFHFFSAFLVLCFMGGLPKIIIFDFELNLIPGNFIIGLLIIVWVTNLFNFMDGINGLAGSQVVVNNLIVGLISIIYFGLDNFVLISFSLAAICSGFLIWNFPNAKVFLGDVGSSFLGFLSGTFFLLYGHQHEDLFWIWLIMFGVFIVDSTYTLIIRAFNKKKVYIAHRLHAYQKATVILNSHSRVTLIIIAINLVFLTPISIFVAMNLIDGFTGVCLAYLPLLIIAMRLKAGQE